jgi:hypothetical protein
MFSGEHSANDISSELFIGGSRRHNMGHSRAILRSKSSSQAEVTASHGKDSDSRHHLDSHAKYLKNSGSR